MSPLRLRRWLGCRKVRVYAAAAISSLAIAVAATHVAVEHSSSGHADAAPLVMCLAVLGAAVIVGYAGVALGSVAVRLGRVVPARYDSPPPWVAGVPARAGPWRTIALQVFRN